MKVVVTGGCGFIGSHLVDRLVEDGHEVVVIDNLSTGNVSFLNPRATLYRMDVLDPAMPSVFKRESPGAVFHLAAQINVRTSVEDPIFDTEVNVIGSLRVIRAFLESPGEPSRKKFVFASTGGAIYGETEVLPTPETVTPAPLCPYGISKLTVEQHLAFYGRTAGLRSAALRYANVYGPRQNALAEAGVVAIFSMKKIAGEPCEIFGDGLQTRDFVFVSDVVEATASCLREEAEGIYNIGTGRETTVNEVYDAIERALGTGKGKVYKPQRPGEVRRSCLDARKAADALGWKPAWPVEKGLQETARWFATSSQSPDGFRSAAGPAAK